MRRMSAVAARRRINGLLNALRRRLRADVSVALIGGGVDATEQISQARDIAIEQFWRAYLAASHATLTAWEPQLTTIPDTPAS